jgi:hypothetical protein
VAYFLAQSLSDRMQLEKAVDAHRWVSRTRAPRFLHRKHDREVIKKAFEVAMEWPS